MSSSNTEIQPMDDIERQRIRAQNVRRLTARFRVLIIGRANAGKTTILQRVCNTTEQPKILGRKGHKVFHVADIII
jgi:50S ribosomal subunit-associated GTPase HflX